MSSELFTLDTILMSASVATLSFSSLSAFSGNHSMTAKHPIVTIIIITHLSCAYNIMNIGALYKSVDINWKIGQ